MSEININNIIKDTIKYKNNNEIKENYFDILVRKISDVQYLPNKGISDFAKHSTKMVGNLFEDFCFLYFQYILEFDNVWKLCDVPKDILNYLNIKSKDYGVDLVAFKKNKYYAIQCKFRTPKINKKTYIEWSKLATFYALCNNSDNFYKHVIFTNVNGINLGNKEKNNKDKYMFYNKLSKITLFDLKKMLNIICNNKVNKEVPDTPENKTENKTENKIENKTENKSEDIIKIKTEEKTEEKTEDIIKIKTENKTKNNILTNIHNTKPKVNKNTTNDFIRNKRMEFYDKMFKKS